MKKRGIAGLLTKVSVAACGLLLLSSSIANAELVVEKAEEMKKEKIEAMEFVHPPEGFYDNYAEVLKKYVDDKGGVDYKGLKADRKALDDFLDGLKDLQLEDYRKWYDTDKVALWINAYNAFTLQIVIDHYPIVPTMLGRLLYPKDSIQQISHYSDEFYLRIVNFSMTLDNIYNNVLRDQFQDPRVHVALSSATVSRAPLKNEPYDGNRIDEQLKEQADTFFADEKNYRLDQQKKVLYVSKIMQWYAKDFTGKYKGKDVARKGEDWSKGILDYISQHIKDQKEVEFLKTQEFDIEFLDYDWSLNERKQ